MARLGKIVLLFILIFIPSLLGAAWAAVPDVKMKVDHTSISLSENIILSIAITNALDTEYPNLTGGEDFEVTLLGPETRIEVINGSVSQDVTYRYRMMPKRIGVLKTPAASVRVGGHIFSLPPIEVKVDKGADLESGEVGRIENFAIQKFSESEIYVAQQVVYDLTTFTSNDPIEFQPENFGFDGFWAEELGKLDKNVSKIRGKNFHTVKSRQALFPLSAGDISIPMRRVTMKVKERQTRRHSPLSDMFGFDPFGDTFFDTAFIGIGERNLQAPEIKLKVMPLPARPNILGTIAPDADIVGATTIKMEGEEKTLEFGDSITLTVVIQSEGNLNPVTSLNIDPTLGFRIYEDPPKTTKFESAGKIVSEKTFKVSLVPERSGDLYLPALKLQYFDPNSKSFSLLETRGLKFIVTGGPITSEEEGGSEITSVVDDPEEALVTEASNSADTNGDSAQTKRYSTEFIFFAACAVLILGFILLGLREIIKRKTGISSVRKSIIAAQDMNSFNKCLTTVIRNQLGIETTGLSNEALKAEIRNRAPDKDISFLLQNLLDELDMMRFGGARGTGLNQLKEKLLQII